MITELVNDSNVQFLDQVQRCERDFFLLLGLFSLFLFGVVIWHPSANFPFLQYGFAQSNEVLDLRKGSGGY